MTEKAPDYLEISADNSFDIDKMKKNLDKIREAVNISNKDFQNDTVAFSAQRIMLEGLLSIIPTAIEHYLSKPGQGSAYSLTNLYSEVTNLFSEIRGSQSLEDQVNYISEQIIDPLLKALTTALFDAVFYEKQQIKQDSYFMDKDPEIVDKIFEEFNKILKSYAAAVNKRKDEAESKLRSYLLEVK